MLNDKLILEYELYKFKKKVDPDHVIPLLSKAGLFSKIETEILQNLDCF